MAKPVYSDRRLVSTEGRTMMVLRDGTTPAGKQYASKIIGMDSLRAVRS